MRRVFAIFLMGLFLVGCSGDMSDLKAYIDKIKNRQKDPNIGAIPEISGYVPYAYKAKDRRSPFKHFEFDKEDRKKTPDTGISPNFERPKDPLERYPLGALTMVGTLTVDDSEYALIRGPGGVVHRLIVGDHLGKDFGEIVEITQTAVHLIEIVPNGLGGYKKRPAIVALAK